MAVDWERVERLSQGKAKFNMPNQAVMAEAIMYFKNLFVSMGVYPGAVIDVDDELNMKYMSPEARKMLGKEYRKSPHAAKDDMCSETTKVLQALVKFVQEKNSRYGNSAAEPIKVFMKERKPDEGVRIRLDDKIKRIRSSVELNKNDVVDLMGYLVLLCAIYGWTDFDDLLD